MTQNVLLNDFKKRATAPLILPIQLHSHPASYPSIRRDLQYAIQAGDESFAPALKLLLDEAVQLARSYPNLPPQAFQIRMLIVKATFTSLLNMETSHPIGKRIQERYRKAYRDNFWDFLKPEIGLAQQGMDEDIICSDGNIDKHLYFILKRLVDIILASALLILFAPLMLCLALLIKLDSPGPVFFVQERVGSRRQVRGGLITWRVCNFKFCKFRSMYTNADQSLHKEYIERWISGQAEDSGDKKAKFKLTNDPRITRIGRFLRRSSLDELPQLFNVLIGDMSLVGPRPVPTYEVGLYQRPHYERLAAIPGITGLWQVEGRGHVGFEEQVSLDIRYIYNQSFWFDLKLLVLTIPAVVSTHGAK